MVRRRPFLIALAYQIEARLSPLSASGKRDYRTRTLPRIERSLRPGDLRTWLWRSYWLQTRMPPSPPVFLQISLQVLVWLQPEARSNRHAQARLGDGMDADRCG